MSSLTLRGIIAAPILPMTDDFEIHWSDLERYMDWIAAQRPTAIAMNMDASEGPSLTRAEQLEVIRVARAAIGGRVPLLSGLIASATADACSWGRELRAAGAEGFAIFPPFPTFLGNPVPAEMIWRYHKAIADAVERPIIGFQFPVAWGPEFPPETLRRLAEIPEFVGIKEASFDTMKTIATIEAARALPRAIGVMTGSDTFIMEAMVFGCDGALIGFAATATERLVEMHRAVSDRRYDDARAIWEALGPLARYCWRAPMRDYRPRMKEVLLMQGLLSSAACRPPQLGIDQTERAELRRLALQAGLLEGASPRAAAQ
jgi:4-hydroxy-tetrahydrodipicolinate synthase